MSMDNTPDLARDLQELYMNGIGSSMKWLLKLLQKASALSICIGYNCLVQDAGHNSMHFPSAGSTCVALRQNHAITKSSQNIPLIEGHQITQRLFAGFLFFYRINKDLRMFVWWMENAGWDWHVLTTSRDHLKFNNK